MANQQEQSDPSLHDRAPASDQSGRDDLPTVAPGEDQPQEAQPSQTPEAQLAALQAERDDLESRLLRVSADYQNYVRRSQQNLTDAQDQQLMQVVKALLTPMDQFDHALAVDPDATTTQAVLQGVQIVRDELQKVFNQFGIKRLEVQPGDEFDPLRHEALQRIATEGVDSGRVAQQVQAGYLLGDKPLRPAKVIIAE